MKMYITCRSVGHKGHRPQFRDNKHKKTVLLNLIAKSSAYLFVNIDQLYNQQSKYNH